ncbi:DUF2971 domain-containing protein [Vreelandella neptunia]|uniref:DUF2971 domain-containing protein n=1 Tax=Vreelandella neptunia TaxID=115551 RepID=A0ABZ0YPK3_9GAMM|nr:DUF2971 domain-containing protein [Halomonas neptunia]MDN3559124.1 DUF2971 domain-containing protein [Halomonas neptunia]WQH14085.1 DUF2971 domain-containing protein [Halomonas neptunia]
MQGFTAFKYVGAERAVQCLKDGTLYLASPDQLNDTLEARFHTASTEAYLAITDATLAELARQRGETSLAFDREALPEFAEVNQRENGRFQAFCKGIGICSLARRPNHQAMWAYYGEGGEGICLELAFTPKIMEANQLLLGPVTYSDQARVLNRAEDWRTTFLELAEQHPQATLKDLQRISLEVPFRRRMGLRMAQRATSTKHPDWAHEDEIRMLGPKGRTPLPILGQVLTRVHFIGFKALNQVAPLLVKHYPHVSLMQWTFDHGELQAHGAQADTYRR